MMKPERIAELKAAGYWVENMGDAYGKEFAGRYRWVLGEFDDFGDEEFSEQAAWENAYACATWSAPSEA